MRTIYHKVDVLPLSEQQPTQKEEPSTGSNMSSPRTHPGKAYAREISVDYGKIEVKEVSLKPEKQRRNGEKEGGGSAKVIRA